MSDEHFLGNFSQFCRNLLINNLCNDPVLTAEVIWRGVRLVDDQEW